MNMKVSVSADLDTNSVEAQLKQFESKLNSMGQSIAKNNKVSFQPVSVKSIADMERFVKQFEALKKISGDLSKRMKATGQSGAGFFDLDWSKMYPDHASMRRQQAKAFEYVAGASFSGSGGGGGGNQGGQSPASVAAAVARQVAGSALNAAGPAGGVVNNAMNTGMKSGFGAGIAGLMGGMLALGVSKLVGAVMEKLDQAEQNAIANDQLKRKLGDVNVSFSALQSSVLNAAKSNHLLFSEAGQLAAQFAKVGNISERQYKSLADEMGTGVGMSRAFGLDPAQGVNALASFRGMRVTGNDQDTRRMALLIGETIGKSDAFAKSGEVMDALVDYTSAQNRLSLNGGNVSGFAGYLSAMAGSGIKGLGVENSAALLNRIVTTLQNGGGAGEASQFFSSRLAEKNGLNPIAGAIWRETPMASVSEAFGSDSAVGRYLSKRGRSVGAGLSGSFYQQTIEQLKADYQDPYMQIEAASKHLGISRNQAAAMLDMDPNRMGELEGRLGKNFNLSNLNGESIATMSRLLGGDSRVMSSVASELRSRTGSDALSPEERSKLNSVMAGGSQDEKINTLISLVATRGQEQTQGKNIHDSKVALDNIKTELASKLIPLTQDIRTGILWMAGGRKMTGAEVLGDIANKESDLRISRIEGDASARKAAADKLFNSEAGKLYMNEDNLSDTAKNSFIWRRYKEKLNAGTATEEDKQAALANLRWRSPSVMLNEQGNAALGALQAARDTEKQQAQKAADDAIKAERDRLSAELKGIEANDRLTKSVDNLNSTLGGKPAGYSVTGGVTPTSGHLADFASVASGKKGAMASDQAFRAAVAEEERRIGAPAGMLWAQLGVESNYRTNAVSPAGALGIAQFMPSTMRSLNKKYGTNYDPLDPYDAIKAQSTLMRENYERYGNWGDALKAYNAGTNSGNWNNSETNAYVPKVYDRMLQGTPMPENPQYRDQEMRFKFDALDINLNTGSADGGMMLPAQQLNTRVVQQNSLFRAS